MDEMKEITVDATLVSNFTHQIINPLNGVVGTLDNLIDGTITGARRDQRLRAARAQLVHVVELVRNLAFLSQLSTDFGRKSIAETGGTCIVPALVIEAAMFFQEIAEERGISIRLDDRETQYAVSGHKDLLRQVFTNLFENAVKYGFENHEVVVSPRQQRTTGQLIVEVINKGPGFAYGDRDKLFERGFRGAEAISTYSSGSGLGLYICREILHLGFNATIEAEHSQKLQETTFRIRFPKSEIQPSRRTHEKE